MFDELQTNPESTIAAIREEEKADYDLRNRLAGLRNRKKSVTVYADDGAGEELGGAEDVLGFGGVKTGKQRRWGLVGKLADLQDAAAILVKESEDEGETAEREAAMNRLAGEIAEVKAQIPAALERMKASAFTFHLRTIPEVIIKDCHRKAREALGITKKGEDVSQNDEYLAEFTANFLVASTEKWVDHGAGKEFTSIDPDQVRAFADLLPRGEFTKIDTAMAELSMTTKIAQQVTDTPDF